MHRDRHRACHLGEPQGSAWHVTRALVSIFAILCCIFFFQTIDTSEIWVFTSEIKVSQGSWTRSDATRGVGFLRWLHTWAENSAGRGRVTWAGHECPRTLPTSRPPSSQKAPRLEPALSPFCPAEHHTRFQPREFCRAAEQSHFAEMHQPLQVFKVENLIFPKEWEHLAVRPYNFCKTQRKYCLRVCASPSPH